MSTIKPGAVPTWATTGGTRVEPTSAEKAAGFAPGDKPPARWLNWLIGSICDWAAYLNSVNTDDAFLGSTFGWTAQHTHALPPKYASPLARTTRLNLLNAYTPDASLSANWDSNGNPIFASTPTNTQAWCVPFQLPPGATFDSIAATVFCGGACNLTMTIYKRTSASSVRSQVGPITTLTGVTGSNPLPSGVITSQTGADDTWYWAQFTSTDTSGAGHIESVAVNWHDASLKR